MTKPLLLAAAALSLAATATGAHAETKLTTTVHTGTPGGFLVTSTLVAGDKDAVLVDGQFTLADAHRVVAMVLESKKNLTTVYVTHSHPDHYFGLVAIKQAFPKAQFVALPGTLAEIEKTYKDKVKQWGPMYGALLTSDPLRPVALKGNTIDLEGQKLEIRGPVQGDSPDNTFVWIPSLRTAIAGDIVYRGVHPWTRETDAAGRKAWIATLDAIAALGPEHVIAGHKDPKFADDAKGLAATRAYLVAFDAALASAKTPADLVKAVKAKYPDLQLDVILTLGAETQFKK
ncbi:MAG: MBL fold metallo-hydrolase [Deltaproteobacteria bacterium]|nr:MBL fold metallo-hydrolase [Deltaproteobacteria bacterium]